jgi:hypothetical protein
MSRDEYDAHCRKPGCRCDHMDCYRGWRDNETTTAPCQWCRFSTHSRWVQYLDAIAKRYPIEARHRILRGEGTPSHGN